MALLLNFSENDLLKLKEDQIAESQTIDYKAAVNNTDEDKKEFLADVSSFANTVGGLLVIGMKEEKGLPIGLPGIQIDDPDAEKLRLEEIIRNGIQPRIPRVAIRTPIKLSNDSWAIVIYIPQSLAAPHIVTYKGSSRFYARNSAGKYILDVAEIRRAFLLSDSVQQKIRDFRLDRIAKIVAGDTPIYTQASPKIVLHSVPLSAYQTATKIEPLTILQASSSGLEDYRFRRYRFNLDGLVFYPEMGESNPKPVYRQVYRNGIFEYVDAHVQPHAEDATKITHLSAPQFEADLIKETERTMGFQKRLGVEPPIYIFISFISVKGVRIAPHGPTSPPSHDMGIDRDILALPEIQFDNYTSDLLEVAKLLKPAFDAAWNAAGWQYSMSYRDGTWYGGLRDW